MYNDVLLFKPKTVIINGEEIEVEMKDYEYLAEQRKALGLTQREVATAARIHTSSYQRLERGEHSLIRIRVSVAYAIFDILKLDPKRFIRSY